MASTRQSPVVVYPYKHTNSPELLWSIKSLKNVEHSDVLVIGDKKEGVEVLSTITPFWGSKSNAHNQIAKYYQACHATQADELLLMNDDIFIMEPWEPENYNKGTLEEHIDRRTRDDFYTKQLRSTLKYLESQGMNTLSFEMHTPMLVDRLLLKEAIEELIPVIRTGKTVLIRSYYGNRWDIDSTFMEDVKNPTLYGNLPIISTDEKSFHRELGNFIRRNI